MNGKGSKPRPIFDKKTFDDTFEKIFGKKKLNIATNKCESCGVDIDDKETLCFSCKNARKS